MTRQVGTSLLGPPVHLALGECLTHVTSVISPPTYVLTPSSYLPGCPPPAPLPSLRSYPSHLLSSSSPLPISFPPKASFINFQVLTMPKPLVPAASFLAPETPLLHVLYWTHLPHLPPPHCCFCPPFPDHQEAPMAAQLPVPGKSMCLPTTPALLPPPSLPQLASSLVSAQSYRPFHPSAQQRMSTF